MADITRTVAVEIDLGHHTHCHSEPSERTDCKPFFAEIHLINLVNRLKDAMIFGKTGEELLHITEGYKHDYPHFVAAIDSFAANAKKLNESRQQSSAQRDLFERLYAAEQLKTQAMMEMLDI